MLSTCHKKHKTKHTRALPGKCLPACHARQLTELNSNGTQPQRALCIYTPSFKAPCAMSPAPLQSPCRPSHAKRKQLSVAQRKKRATHTLSNGCLPSKRACSPLATQKTQ